MAGLNEAAMTVAGNALRTALAYAQLHSSSAGSSGTANVTTAARKAITWSVVTGFGDFGLNAQLDFTGGTPNGKVYSVTLWSAVTSGTYYGEFIIKDPDAAFNSGGDYSLTSLDLDGSAS